MLLTCTYRLLLAASIAMCLSTFADSAYAGLFTWVDDKGVVHITDDPTGIPEKSRSAAEIREAEPQDVEEWVPYGENLPGSKWYFDKGHLVKKGHTVTVRTKTVNEPPQNTGIFDGSGGKIRIAFMRLLEQIDCREQTWKLLDRWYFDPEGKELTILRETDQRPEASIMASQHPLAAALYRSICVR